MKRVHRRQCSVPGCLSHSSVPGNSYHEFPSNDHRRNLWIEAIFKGGETCHLNDRSTVCGMHFKDTDIIVFSSKLKRLTLSAVPSLHLPGSDGEQRNGRGNGPQSASAASGMGPELSLQPFEHVKIESIDELEDYTTQYPENCHLSSAPAEKRKCTPNSENCRPSLVPPEKRKCLLLQVANKSETYSKGIQVDIVDYRKVLENKNKIKLLKQNATRDLVKISRLKAALQASQERLNQVPHLKVIDVIEKDALEGNHSAMFLRDQIINYGKTKKQCKWSDSSILNCMLWRDASTKGYERARQLFIKAPSNATMCTRSKMMEKDETCQHKLVKVVANSKSSVKKINPKLNKPTYEANTPQQKLNVAKPKSHVKRISSNKPTCEANVTTTPQQTNANISAIPRLIVKNMIMMGKPSGDAVVTGSPQRNVNVASKPLSPVNRTVSKPPLTNADKPEMPQQMLNANTGGKSRAQITIGTKTQSWQVCEIKLVTSDSESAAFREDCALDWIKKEIT